MLPEIKVKIGADTSGLEKGISSATSSLGKFAKQAAVALGVAGAAGGFVAMTKAAIDNADALDNMAQRLGITVEALSRLQFAAKLSDTSIQSLQVGFRTLATNMVAGSDAFSQLGISLQNADGTMRSSVDVFSEIADRFAAMENGALKSSIAVDLFGRSGLDLIPLLNEGSAGLAEFARQSDAIGNTISTNTATAAAEFNDTLDVLNSKFTGIVNNVMKAVLPALNGIADTLDDVSPEAIGILAAIAGSVAALGAASAVAAPGIAALSAALGGLATAAAAIAAIPGGVAFLAGGIFAASTTAVNQNEDAVISAIQARADAMKKLKEDLSSESYGDTSAFASIFASPEAAESEIEAIKEHHATIQTLEKDHVQKVSGIRREGQNQDLQYMGQFFSSVGSIMESGGNEMLGLAKAFGSAQALINTFVAGSQALADPTVPFWGKAAAFASMIATGLSAVSAIKGASKNAGGGAASAAGTPAAAAPAMNRTLTVQGITPGQIFSGDSMRDFMEQMLQMQRDGYQVVLA